MIATIRGLVVDKGDDFLVIEIGGIGFQVFVPREIKDKVSIHEQIFLHTYLVVREDQLTLYGFTTKEEKELFNIFLGVSGIGPRLALASLSTLNPESIRRAVFHEQAEVFTRIPGVGKRTAQKILIHLQDRIGEIDNYTAMTSVSDVDTEVIEALTSLGYSIVEAQAALQMIPKDAPQEVESRLMLALQYFSN